ncbi:MAG: protein kinase [Acidobacteriota bacterium]
MIGRTLNQFKVTRRLGRGGMGEVFVAEDTRLRRQVALKVLPASMADDPERRARFEREARSVAALNHPNIVTIHSVEQAGGVHFITMELVEGQTLTETIPRNGFSLGRFFELAVPLADAVAAAHAGGITHRDLKPDNIMVSKEGRLKVLDFGLAKLRESAPEAPARTQAPTVAQTEEGVILGTVAYMSPEQAEGKPIDHRSDIFSLGVVLYQMATGEAPFKGDTKVSLISSILRDIPPPVTDLNRALPRHLGRIIKRCLAKEPQRRAQSALDLRNELAELQEEVASGATLPVGQASTGSRGRRWALTALVGVGAAVVILTAGYFLRFSGSAVPPDAPAPLQATFTKLTDPAGVEFYVTLSPDGRTVAYAAGTVGNQDIFVQRVGGRNPMNLTGDCKKPDTMPAFSPDGDRIVFRSECEGGGLFVMGATGESIRRLTDFGFHPAWSPDGREIVFADGFFVDPRGRGSSTSALWIVKVATGETRKIFDGDAVQPSWSPHGARIAYWGLPESGGGQRDIYTIALDGTGRVPVTLDVPVDWNPVWGPDGKYLYFVSDRSGTMNLWRVLIDETSGEVTGPPRQITTGVSAWSQHPGFSRDGRRLAYVSMVLANDLYRVGFDPATRTVLGAPDRVPGLSSVNGGCAPSPDGEWLACATAGKQEDIIVARTDGTGRRRLTNDSFKDRLPRWSPDGKKLVFYSDRGGKYEIWTIAPDGTGLRRLSDAAGSDLLYPVFSPDGKRMIVSDLDKKTTLIVDPARPWSEQSPRALDPVDDEGRGFIALRWSPDGRALSGPIIDKDGTNAGNAIYDLDSGEYRSVSASSSPLEWLPGGRGLLFANASEIQLFDETAGTTRDLLSMDNIQGLSIHVSSDGKTLYFAGGPMEADVWLMELKEGRF